MKTSRQASHKSAAGFTLLEIVIAVSILAFISLFVARTIQKGMEAKVKIQRDIDRTVSLREALNLVARDVENAFHYRDINVELYNAALDEGCKKPGQSQQQQQQQQQGQPPPPPPVTPPIGQQGQQQQQGGKLSADQCAARKEQKIKTQFIGEDAKLNFTTLSNIRTQRDEETSDQSEVGYELKDCRSAANRGGSSSSCLWRRTSPIIDDKPLEGGSSAVLLEHVKKLSFRYLGPGENLEWVKSWRTDGQSGGGDSKTADQFPLAVEITLEIEDRNVKPPKLIGMTVVAPIRFTNNAAPVDPNAQTTNTGTGQQQQGFGQPQGGGN